MSVLLRWDGYGLVTADTFLPGITGMTDINCFNAEQSNFQDPFELGWPGTGNVLIDSAVTISSRTNVPRFTVRDSAFGSVTRPYVAPDFSKAYSGAPSGTFSVYSLRYYFYCSGTPSIAAVGTIGLWAGTGGLDFNGLCVNTGTGKAIIPGMAGEVGSSIASQWIRVEIQVNTAFSPKIDMRWYAGDSTTMLNRFTWSGALNASQYLMIGDVRNTASPNISFANIEFCNTYDLDGKFPGGTASPSSTTNASGTGTPVTTIYALPADLSNGTVPSASYTTYTDVAYASNYARDYNLYVPTGVPANSAGFPLVIWAHSGFFVYGNKEVLPAAWRNTLLNAGYAVATIRYLKSSVAGSGNPYYAYGTYDPISDGVNVAHNAAYGRYPSWIVDYKLASVRIAAKCSTASGGDNTYANVDGSRMFATGYSAGGYIALGAAVSKGLTSDGAPTAKDLTIAGNATYNDGYAGSDPTYIGSFAYAAPIDMDVMCAFDSSDPGYGPILNPNKRGVIVAAAQAFQGQAQSNTVPTMTNTNIPNLITKNVTQNGTGAIPKIGYTRGSGDYLVHWANEPLLSAAMTSNGIAAKYYSYTTATNHDQNLNNFRSTDIITFLNDRVAESGGVSGFASWVPRAVVS